jgi:hypothetical protein
MKKLSFIVTVLLMATVTSFSQVTKVPDAAKENFTRQYPNAQDIDWDNDVVNVNVRFTLDGESMNAEYNNKGIWRSTIQKFNFVRLPEAVKNGFSKSKYADREVKEVVVVHYPGDVTQYRIKVEKSSVEKKYLYFSPEGKLIRDSITL